MPLCLQNLWCWRKSSNEVPKTPPKKQLLYELSRIVFEYMEPSFRIHLSANLAPLRSVEKGTHLKINELILCSNCIFIDKTKYLLSIVNHDADEFEFKTFPVITKDGDVCMENYKNRDMEDDESGYTVAMKMRELYKCKSTLKLTIVSENRELWSYSSSKITKIQEGMKILIAAIFGDRTVSWNVESMIISTGNLRWIVSGMKPLARNIQLEGYYSVNLDGLRSICHPSSFPLKSLNFEMDPDILDHEILVNAECLFIYSGKFVYKTDFMRQLVKVSNLKVRLFRTSVIFFSELMDVWLKDGRPVGTSWSFEVEGNEPSQYINFLRENEEVIESDRRLTVFPLKMSVKQNLWSWRELSNELPITLSKQQLTYELSQIVFEYMDTNFRIHLSANLPPLRSVEKGTHLKINELILRSDHIFIDKTKYQLSIVDDDVDEFEFKIFPDITKNGDVCMENYNIEEDEETGYTAAMKIREISKCESTLKLTIVSENRERWIYTSSKTTKVHEGMKMLIGVIFGNRTVIWNVDTMIISTANLRWIVSGVKPLCRNIRLEGYHYVNLDGLRSICHQTSFPLKTLDLEIDYRILDHEILVNAEHLLIHTGVQRFNISFMYQLNKVTHRKVQIFCILPTFFAYFMDLWLDDGKPVGTSWSFRVQDTEPSEYIDVLKGNAQVIESDRRSIKLSMGPSSILSVSYDDPEHDDRGFYQRDAWAVKMEVLQR
ncbi:unnamed protein product [Caenorhabditis nigoni]